MNITSPASKAFRYFVIDYVESLAARGGGVAKLAAFLFARRKLHVIMPAEWLGTRLCM